MSIERLADDTANNWINGNRTDAAEQFCQFGPATRWDILASMMDRELLTPSEAVALVLLALDTVTGGAQ